MLSWLFLHFCTYPLLPYVINRLYRHAKPNAENKGFFYDRPPEKSGRDSLVHSTENGNCKDGAGREVDCLPSAYKKHA